MKIFMQIHQHRFILSPLGHNIEEQKSFRAMYREKMLDAVYGAELGAVKSRREYGKGDARGNERRKANLGLRIRYIKSWMGTGPREMLTKGIVGGLRNDKMICPEDVKSCVKGQLLARGHWRGGGKK